MNKLIKEIENLKQSEVKIQVDSKIKEFKELGKKSSNELFKELCFCLLTANYNAVGGIKIQEQVGNGFCTLPEKKLAKKLTELGHRFPNARAKYIFEARKHTNSLKALNSKTNEQAREWLVQNVKGLGYKEASHFLRNIGYNDFAIIDFHIIDLLVRNNLIEKPKTLTKNKYLEIESLLRKVAEKSKLTLAELDVYLWYMETGKILK